MTTTTELEEHLKPLQALYGHPDRTVADTAARAAAFLIHQAGDLDQARQANALHDRIVAAGPAPWWLNQVDPLLAYLDAAGDDEKARGIREIVRIFTGHQPD